MRTATLRRLPAALTALALSLLLSMFLLSAGAQGAVNYTKESLKAYEEQLAAGQIKEVTINKRLRSLRVTLTDGRHVLAKYAAHGGNHEREKLEARHVKVHVLSSTQAKSVAERGKTKVHHKIRYIVGGVVIAIAVIVGGVLFYNRRKRAEAGI